MYCYVWEFIIHPGCRDAFESAYGPDGDWARLFRRGEGYVRTELLRGHDGSARYLTVDYWTSREDCVAFRHEYRAEFDALDRQFESLTLNETHLGDFEVLA